MSRADLRADPNDWLGYHEGTGSLNPGAGNIWNCRACSGWSTLSLAAHRAFLGASDGASVLRWTWEVNHQIADFRLQISDLRSQISDFRSQISDFRLQIPDFRLRNSEFRSQISDFRSQISDLRCQ